MHLSNTHPPRTERAGCFFTQRLACGPNMYILHLMRRDILPRLILDRTSHSECEAFFLFIAKSTRATFVGIDRDKAIAVGISDIDRVFLFILNLLLFLDVLLGI